MVGLKSYFQIFPNWQRFRKLGGFASLGWARLSIWNFLQPWRIFFSHLRIANLNISFTHVEEIFLQFRKHKIRNFKFYSNGFSGNFISRFLQSPIIGNRAKGESQNGCFRKTKHAKFSGKTNISYPDRFYENLACIVFLKHPLRFALLPHNRQNVSLPDPSHWVMTTGASPGELPALYVYFGFVGDLH